MKNLKNKSNLKWWVLPLGLAAGFFVFLYDYLPYKIARTNDISLPYRWWILETDVEKLSVGDYVEFVPPVKNEYTEGKLLVKQIACGPNDVLMTQGKDYYCNGTQLGGAVERDKNGKPARAFIYKGNIPGDSYFVMGTHPQSYDSRYWGFVRKKHIKHRAYPIASGR